MHEENNIEKVGATLEPAPEVTIELVPTGEHTPPAPVLIQNNIQQTIRNFQSVVMGFADGSVDVKKALADLAGCNSDVDVLKYSLDRLSECMAIATATYQQKPIPDNAYQLAALTSSYNNTYSLLEKQKDPVKVVAEISEHIKLAFMKILHAMALAINTTKGEILSKYPDDRSTVEDSFGRMLEAIEPQSQGVFDDLESFLKATLGVKR